MAKFRPGRGAACFAAVMLAAAGLTGCANGYVGPPPDAGRIVEMHHYPQWTELCTEPKTWDCIRAGTNQVVHPEKWCLLLEKDANDQTSETQGTTCVDRAVYDQYQVGNHYPKQ